MKILAIILLVLVSGCTAVPVTQQWPKPPGALVMEPCPNLQPLDQNTQLSGVAKVVVNNYSEYYTCAAKLNAWQRWYAEQKVLFERLK